MKVYFLADTHLGMKGDNEIWLKECYEYYIKSLIPYLIKNVHPDDILIHCGDVFDNRSNIGIQTINVAITLFEKFSEIFNDIRIIVGNHDMMRKHDTKMTGFLNSSSSSRTSIALIISSRVEKFCSSSGAS